MIPSRIRSTTRNPARANQGNSNHQSLTACASKSRLIAPSIMHRPVPTATIRYRERRPLRRFFKSVGSGMGASILTVCSLHRPRLDGLGLSLRLGKRFGKVSKQTHNLFQLKFSPPEPFGACNQDRQYENDGSKGQRDFLKVTVPADLLAIISGSPLRSSSRMKWPPAAAAMALSNFSFMAISDNSTCG